jgi:two-component system phosphate regulon response regulator PhoB
VVEARRILLVQDDDTLRRAHRFNLELAGVAVTEASNGEQALRQARESPPDLVVLDLMLASLDGWETLGELKTDPVLQSLPVVILTSSPEESEELRALERGALVFIAQPISIEDLIAVVQRALARAT